MFYSILKKVLISIFSLSSILLFSTGQNEIESNRTSKSGVIEYLEGDVFINDSPADIGDIVNNTDLIRTGDNSFCEIVFSSLNVFQLEENTLTQIDWAKSDINLQKGTLSAVFTKLDKFLNDDKDFTISTPSVTAGVRGTVFFVKVEDEQNTYLCICNGELNVQTTNSVNNIASAHHEAYRFTREGDSTRTNEAPMIYHDDEKMNAVAKRINYEVPWDDTGYGY